MWIQIIHTEMMMITLEVFQKEKYFRLVIHEQPEDKSKQYEEITIIDLGHARYSLHTKQVHIEIADQLQQ